MKLNIQKILAFPTFYIILCSSFLHRQRDLTSYKLLILRTYRPFSRFCWLDYDQAFREHAPAENVTNWCRMYVQLSTTIQLVLKFTLAQHQMFSRPRQRPLVMLLAKSCAIHGLMVTSSSVELATCVAGNGTIIMLLLVDFRFRFLLFHTLYRHILLSHTIYKKFIN